MVIKNFVYKSKDYYALVKSTENYDDMMMKIMMTMMITMMMKSMIIMMMMTIMMLTMLSRSQKAKQQARVFPRIVTQSRRFDLLIILNIKNTI